MHTIKLWCWTCVLPHIRASCSLASGTYQPSHLLVIDLCISHSFRLVGSGIVSQTIEAWVLSLEWRAALRLLPVCTAWCGQRGQGLMLLTSVWTEHRGGCLHLTSPGTLTQNCFLDPSVVKSENVLCTITQANTMSQDKYALLVSRPELK